MIIAELIAFFGSWAPVLTRQYYNTSGGLPSY